VDLLTDTERTWYSFFA